MLEFCIDRQKIKRSDLNYIVGNSSDYLTAEFSFSNDWRGLAKTAIFAKTGTSLAVLLDENNQITEEKHLNLTPGQWLVSVVGVLDARKIITNIATITVVDSGAENGTVPADPTPSVYDQIVTQLQAIQDSITAENLPSTIVGRDANGSTELNSLKLDLTLAGTPTAGDIYYNVGLKMPEFKTASGVTIPWSGETTRNVNNKTVSAIPNGTLVSWSTTDGNSGNFNVVPYIADGSMESERIVGVTTESIPAGGNGLVTFNCVVNEINTTGAPVGETWVGGTILYASPTSAGKFTSVKPVYPPHKITRIGMVINAHATVGNVYIQRTNYPLADQIGVLDAANHFTSVGLENILAEIGTRITALET